MEDAVENQQYLPPLVLCEKNRNVFSLVGGKDFFSGEDIYMSIRGGKRVASEERVIVLGGLTPMITKHKAAD